MHHHTEEQCIHCHDTKALKILLGGCGCGFCAQVGFNWTCTFFLLNDMQLSCIVEGKKKALKI